MNTFVEGLRFIFDAANWPESDGIAIRLVEHVELSFASLVMATLIAVPVGLVVGHTRRGQFVAVQTANLGRAIPSLAILGLAYLVVQKVAPELAFGFLPTLVALTLLGIPPILVNTYVGIQQVDADAVEAARGMGMTGREILTGLEIPLAMPLIMTGIRLAALQIVATATLSALIAGGTLGRLIVDGYAQAGGDPMLVAGAILVALLAILTDVLFGLLARVTAPRVTSRSRNLTG